ncbi:hypothetical protein QP948_09090 [Corynebacterium bovis]|uniref:hypothetical protein n=1 Tax=Corynebacterium bovis TaxID=36808 RepID=UPI00254EE337|nr:hypothetical protein [Corynebacterium bovis]MDK8511540.1 hypothetical protein [Corynebacterium bovis]
MTGSTDPATRATDHGRDRGAGRGAAHRTPRRAAAGRLAATGVCGALALSVAACDTDGPGDRLSSPEKYSTLSLSGEGEGADATASGTTAPQSGAAGTRTTSGTAGAGASGISGSSARTTADPADRPTATTPDAGASTTPHPGGADTRAAVAGSTNTRGALAADNGSCIASRATLTSRSGPAELRYTGSAGDQVRYAYMFRDGRTEEHVTTVPDGRSSVTVSDGPQVADLNGVAVALLGADGGTDTCLVPLNGPQA